MIRTRYDFADLGTHWYTVAMWQALYSVAKTPKMMFWEDQTPGQLIHLKFSQY